MEKHTHSNWLLEHRNNITSSHGEDGIITKIFETIGEESHWCVELGALNGLHDSNVWSLIKMKGWSGVLIEADPTYYENLVAEYQKFPDAHCVKEFVSFEGPHSLDSIFTHTPLPKQFDLLSLDIDGNEYHLWESLTTYTPRVLVVEFNPSIPNDIDFVQPRDMHVYQGSSLKSLVALGKKKGYELVCANEANAFFVRAELFPLFGSYDNAIDMIRTDRQFETKLYQLYDGTLMLAGNTRMLWHGIPIDADKLQVLPEHKRRYPACISPWSPVRTLKYFVRKMPLYAGMQKLRKMLGP
ncbi:MAG: hypothetical protein AAB737_04590 [Patescibacteria group bacterium]